MSRIIDNYYCKLRDRFANASGGGGGLPDPRVWIHTGDSSSGEPTVQLDSSFPTYVSTASLVFPGSTQEGTGSRLVFNPVEGSLRAGLVSGSQWDDVNRGTGSVAFGENNTASGLYSTIPGGSGHTASGQNSVILGGSISNVSGLDSGVLAGTEHVVSGARSAVAGGENNQVLGNNSIIGGGNGNYIDAVDNAGILGGSSHTVNSDSSVIAGGSSNTVNGVYSAIIGGELHTIGSNATGCAIIGGSNCSIASGFTGSVILGGQLNTLRSNCSVMAGIVGESGSSAQTGTAQDYTTYMRRLRTSGGHQIRYIGTNATNYSMGLDDHFLALIVTGVTGTVTLPATGDAVPGQVYIIRRSGVGNLSTLTIDPNGCSIVMNGTIGTISTPYNLPTRTDWTLGLVYNGQGQYECLWFDINPGSSNTASRPTEPLPYMSWFDTTLNRPIWWDPVAAAWVRADGSPA